MDSLSELKEASDAIAIFQSSRPNQIAFSFMIETFGKSIPFNVITNISKNIKLFRIFQMSGCEKFVAIDKAIEIMIKDEKHRQKILIHFTELNLYGIFTPEQYTDLTNTLADKIQDGINITFRPKQIILTGLPQKLIFICTGGEDILLKIREHVSRKYKCDISYKTTDDRTEITVQNLGGNNYEEAQKIYCELFDYINREQFDNVVADKLLPMPVIKCNDKSFISADVSYDISKPQDISEVISSLKTIHNGNVVINLTIVNGGNNVINYNPKPIDPSSGACDWIKSNPPTEKESTGDYYERYCNSGNGDKVVVNIFGKLVRAEGFITAQGTKCRYWIKK